MNAPPDEPAVHAPLPSDRIELDLQPARRSIIVLSFGWLVLAIIVAIVCGAAMLSGFWPNHQLALLLTPIALVLVVLSIAAIVRNFMHYQLSRVRVRAARGVLSRVSTEARLADLQNVTVTRTLLQRLLTLGTIRMTTAGVGPDVVWAHVAQPDDLAGRLRRAIDAAHGESGSVIRSAAKPIHRPVAPITHPPSPSHPLPVIGLAGGIGAGKSAVAKAFERLGCFVIDSDARAKAALDRPDVRQTLVGWWGNDILTPEGRVDRSKVAAIVFADPAHRTKLEQLVHPIVREDRAAMIREAVGAGAKAVIVDAPLLFEAGVDAECDCAVFVDAPRGQRLERVRQARGWDEPELARREATQMPLDEKRRRCRFVVENHGKLGDLDSQVSAILAQAIRVG